MNDCRSRSVIVTDRGAMPIYVRAPAGPGPWPGVVVLSALDGLSAEAEAKADWLAANGFLAAAPDLFYWARRETCVKELFVEVFRGRGGVMIDDVREVRSWLQDDVRCAGGIGLFGRCVGGSLAYRAARASEYAAAALFDVGLGIRGEEPLLGTCPIVASYGARSPTASRTASSLHRRLTAAGVANDVKTYATVGHSFILDQQPKSRVIQALHRVTGARANPAVARDAKARTIDFFHLHLG